MADIPAIAKVHRAAFPKSLSSALGQKYIEKMLEWFVVTKKAFIFYAVDDYGKVVGYCGGLINDGSLPTGPSSGMFQYSFYQGIFSLILRPWIIFHPEIRKKYTFVLNNLKQKFFNKLKQKRSKQQVKKERITDVALVGIGVKPEYFGSGISNALLKEFEQYAMKNNIHTIFLSVHVNNHRAIRAYKKNGWETESIKGHSLVMNKYLGIEN